MVTSPYTKNKASWAEGEKVKATHVAHIETGIYSQSFGALSVREEPYNAKGDGVTDDAAAFNAALLAASPPGEQGMVYVPPGEYYIGSALKIPELVTMYGLDRRLTTLVAHGEFSLLDVTGNAVAIRGMFLRCATPQATKGAAIDLSHGFSVNLQISDIQVGSNFFNGFNLVGATSASSISITNVLFEEFTGQVEKFGNAAFVIGQAAPEKRTFVVNMVNVVGAAKKQADMPAWFKIANTDSLFMNNCGFQNGVKGMIVGEGDTSTLGTTNLGLDGVWMDGGSEGMGSGYQLQALQAADFIGCHAQSCNPGMLVFGAVNATVTGGKYYHNFGSGIWISSAAKEKSSFTITGALIANNNQSKSAAAKEASGVYLENKASGVLLSGNTISQQEGLSGGGEQKYGVYVEGAECKNYGIVANRIFGNLTKNIEDKGPAEGAGETVKRVGFNLLS